MQKPTFAGIDQLLKPRFFCEIFLFCSDCSLLLSCEILFFCSKFALFLSSLSICAFSNCLIMFILFMLFVVSSCSSLLCLCSNSSKLINDELIVILSSIFVSTPFFLMYSFIGFIFLSVCCWMLFACSWFFFNSLICCSIILSSEF